MSSLRQHYAEVDRILNKTVFLERTPRNDRKSISQEAYLCHSYVTSSGLCACVIADEGLIHNL